VRGLQVNFFFSIFHDQFYTFPRHLKKLNPNAFLWVVLLLIRFTFYGQSLFFPSILLLRPDLIYINYSNWASHGETYLAKCKAKGITPHPCELAHSDKPSDECTEQQSIEGFSKPVLRWSQEGLLEHLIEHIATEDEVYNPISLNLWF